MSLFSTPMLPPLQACPLRSACAGDRDGGIAANWGVEGEGRDARPWLSGALVLLGTGCGLGGSQGGAQGFFNV